MAKIVRLNDETERLINLLREAMKNDLKKKDLELLEGVLDNDNIIIQTAIRLNLQMGIYLVDGKIIKE